MDFSESYLDTCSSAALAARAGNVELLKRLVGDCVRSVNVQDNRGWKAIHEAAFWSNVECLKIVLENGIFFFALYQLARFDGGVRVLQN